MGSSHDHYILSTTPPDRRANTEFAPTGECPVRSGYPGMNRSGHPDPDRLGSSNDNRLVLDRGEI